MYRITANVLYVPVIKAPPLPPLRASAYRAGTYLVGPDDDPSGWYTLSPPKLNINVKERPSLAADIACTVNTLTKQMFLLLIRSVQRLRCQSSMCLSPVQTFVVLMLAYRPSTRGTVIPCYLICEAPDQSEIDEIGVLLHAFTSQ
ncbi:hypothetical protein H1R20_g13415, partial [Candolleomyces eurysporus]